MRQLMLLIVATATLVACNTNPGGAATTADVGALDAGILEDGTAGPTDPADPGPDEGNGPPADCSGCLQGAADCLTQCQNEGFSDGYCVAPGSLNPEICCLCNNPNDPPPAPANYTESDCFVTPSNDTEVCDDEGFTVGSNTDLALVCMGNQGGKVYIASNTGPAMFDGIHRCQGWETTGQNAWDHLDYIAAIVCDGTQSVLDVDLSNWAGQKVYVGVHDHPNQGAGHDTMACIVNSKNPGSGGTVTPPPPTGAHPEPDPPSTEGCKLGGLYNDAIKASVLATAKYVKKKHPEFFDIEDWDNLAKRKQAYKMMTVVINHLRAQCVNASRCVANSGPESDPFHWCSDALVIGPPGQGTTVDVYGDWSSPAKPQAYVTEDGGETGVVTADLVPLP